MTGYFKDIHVTQMCIPGYRFQSLGIKGRYLPVSGHKERNFEIALGTK